MAKTEYCVYCDKRLSSAESQAITELERRYYFILCKKHLADHRREVGEILPDDVITNEEGIPCSYSEGYAAFVKQRRQDNADVDQNESSFTVDAEG